MSGLFPFFHTKQLKPAWEFDAGAIIWRIFFNSKCRIIGESRDENAKRTKFFCIDGISGRALWKNLEFNEPWWIGIETVDDRWIVLHGYDRPDMPEHKGIHLVDIETGKLKWKNNDFAFWFLTRDRVYAQKFLFEKRIGYELDLENGEVVASYEDRLDVLYEKWNEAVQEKTTEHNNISFPELYALESSESSVNEAVEEITGGKALNGWIEFFANHDVLALSYYIKDSGNAQSLSNLLCLYDLVNRKILFNRTIDKGLAAPTHDSFFIKIPFIYFIEKRNKLTALTPWKS